MRRFLKESSELLSHTHRRGEVWRNLRRSQNFMYAVRKKNILWSHCVQIGGREKVVSWIGDASRRECISDGVWCGSFWKRRQNAFADYCGDTKCCKGCESKFVITFPLEQRFPTVSITVCKDFIQLNSQVRYSLNSLKFISFFFVKHVLLHFWKFKQHCGINITIQSD